MIDYISNFRKYIKNCFLYYGYFKIGYSVGKIDNSNLKWFQCLLLKISCINLLKYMRNTYLYSFKRGLYFIYI